MKQSRGNETEREQGSEPLGIKKAETGALRNRSFRLPKLTTLTLMRQVKRKEGNKMQKDDWEPGPPSDPDVQFVKAEIIAGRSMKEVLTSLVDRGMTPENAADLVFRFIQPVRK